MGSPAGCLNLAAHERIPVWVEQCGTRVRLEEGGPSVDVESSELKDQAGSLDFECYRGLLHNADIGCVFRNCDVHGSRGDKVVVVATTGETNARRELTLSFAELSLVRKLEELDDELPVGAVRDSVSV